MTFVGPLADRLEIRELVDSYGDAVARRDKDDWGATWAEDAEWHIMGEVIKGRPQIVTFWSNLMAQFSFAGFALAPGAIIVNGDQADARVYATEELWDSSGKVTRINGRYDDVLVRTDAGWRFKRRTYTILHQS